MIERINLGASDTITEGLRDLLALADEFGRLPANELSADQLLVLLLKRLIAMKQAPASASGGKDCFICGTAA